MFDTREIEDLIMNRGTLDFSAFTLSDEEKAEKRQARIEEIQKNLMELQELVEFVESNGESNVTGRQRRRLAELIKDKFLMIAYCNPSIPLEDIVDMESGDYKGELVKKKATTKEKIAEISAKLDSLKAEEEK